MSSASLAAPAGWMAAGSGSRSSSTQRSPSGAGQPGGPTSHPSHPTGPSHLARPDSRPSSKGTSSSAAVDKRTTLARALQQANSAVVLDNGHNFDAAIEAYADACQLLQAVMERSPNDEDRRRLVTIQMMYENRIQELEQLRSSPAEADAGAVPLSGASSSIASAAPTPVAAAVTAPPRKPTTAAAAPSRSVPAPASSPPPPPPPPLASATVAAPTPTPVSTPPQGRSAKTGGTKPSGRSTGPSVAAGPSPISRTVSQPTTAASSAPRRTRSSTGASASTTDTINTASTPASSATPSAAPSVDDDKTDHGRTFSSESISWLDTIDESASSSAASSIKAQSQHQPRTRLRSRRGFGAELDAAVEAAYAGATSAEQADPVDPGGDVDPGAEADVSGRWQSGTDTDNDDTTDPDDRLLDAVVQKDLMGVRAEADRADTVSVSGSEVSSAGPGRGLSRPSRRLRASRSRTGGSLAGSFSSTGVARPSFSRASGWSQSSGSTMSGLPSLPSTSAFSLFPARRGLTAGQPAETDFFDADIHSPDRAGNPRAGAENAPQPLEPCPTAFMLRPYWLMRALYQTIVHPRGGYLSTRLFVPRDVWRVRAVRIKALDDKVACCDLLTAALLKVAAVDSLDADAVLDEMQALETVLDTVQMNLSKRLGSEVGVTGAAVLWKDLPSDTTASAAGTASDSGSVASGPTSATSAPTTAGSKLPSQAWSYLSSLRKLRHRAGAGTGSGLSALSKDISGSTAALSAREGMPATLASVPMTSTVHVRLPRREVGHADLSGANSGYVSSLARLFDAAQVVDQVTRQVEDPGLRHSSPTQVGIELCARHAAEFFAFFICRFVMADLMILLDKFIKRGSEWAVT